MYNVIPAINFFGSKKVKLDAALQLFLNEYEKASTRRAYAQTLQPLIAAIGPRRDLSLISRADIHSYVADFPDDYSPATRQKHIKNIKTFFNFLVRLDELQHSPASTLKQKRLRGQVKQSAAATDDEVEKMLKVAYGDARNYALIQFLADTGCRIGGASMLRVKDLDLDNLTCTVIEKGDKMRPAWYGSDTAHALRLWLIQKPPGEFVFCKWDGSRMTPPALAQVIRRTSRKAGIRSLGPHSLRHRKGHQLADAGVAPTIAAQALGHSDVKITLEYYYPHDYERAEQAIRSTHEPPREPQKIVKFPKVR